MRSRSLARPLLCALASVVLASCGNAFAPPGATGTPGAAPSPAAIAGKALFFDITLSVSGKQSCGTCHAPERAFAGDPATDRGLPVALGGPRMDQTGLRNSPGVPRNWRIPANRPRAVSPIDGAPLVTVLTPVDVPADAEYGYYDLGLCGPLQPAPRDKHARPNLSATKSLCGLFKVPTLRNVAVTAPYFHNGVFSDLHQVIEWYVTRDLDDTTGSNPNPYAPAGTFYTGADGSPDPYPYNDLPAEYDANVNVGEIPYTPPTFQGGQAPTLTAREIDEVVAFLCTLTDGYDPEAPENYGVPAQCQPAAGLPAAASP